jgi:GT2 family glycosyltransferase
VSGRPAAAVVVPTRGRPRLAREAVDSILAGTLVPAEILVVDQSDEPDPGLAALAEGATPVRYLPTRSRGLSRARNEGLAAATAEVVALTDDDVLAEPGWLAALVDAVVEAGPGAVVTGAVREGEPEVDGGFVPASAHGAERAVYRGRQQRDVLAGGNLGAYRQALLDAGAFDERLGAGSRYPAAEDNDLGLRLLDAGFAIVYEPTAVVVHRAWRPAGDYVRVRWRYGLGKGGFYAKHARPDGYGLRRLARDCGARLGRLPRNAVVARRRAVGDLAYVAGVLAGLVRWTATERGR